MLVSFGENTSMLQAFRFTIKIATKTFSKSVFVSCDFLARDSQLRRGGVASSSFGTCVLVTQGSWLRRFGLETSSLTRSTWEQVYP